MQLLYRDVDYDEMAWELEKCLTYHFIAQLSGKSQMIMNEEATMARRGLGTEFFGCKWIKCNIKEDKYYYSIFR